MELVSQITNKKFFLRGRAPQGSKRAQGCPLAAAGRSALLKMPSRSTNKSGQPSYMTQFSNYHLQMEPYKTFYILAPDNYHLVPDLMIQLRGLISHSTYIVKMPFGYKNCSC
jgi:hypothetical protein